MTRVQTARYQIRDAALSGEFGQQMAQKWFGRDLDSLVAEFGTYKSGPRKGLCKGYVVWLKIDAGGWVYQGYDRGFVLHPSHRVHCVVDNEMRATIINQPSCEAINTIGRFYDRQDPKTSHDRAMRDALDRLKDRQDMLLAWLDAGAIDALNAIVITEKRNLTKQEQADFGVAFKRLADLKQETNI